MNHSARDVMTKSLVTLGPNTTAQNAIEELLKHKISGAPVVDLDGELVGIVSEYQLLAVIYDEEFKNQPIKELMTNEVLTVEEDTLLTEIANLFIVHRIRRLPVLRDGELVGQISRRDIIRFAVQNRDAVQENAVAVSGAIG
jgi:CBS domain-containing protein